MDLLIFGLLYSLACILSGFYLFRLTAVVFFTSWCLYIQFFTFLYMQLAKSKSVLAQRLLITSWTLGWVVCLMFWTYVYPLTDKLPPWPHYFSTHGGVHFILCLVFTKSNLPVEKTDILWPLFVTAFYLFGMVLPLKAFEITIYPLLFENLGLTIVVLIAVFTLNTLAFTVGLKLKTSKALKGE